MTDGLRLDNATCRLGGATILDRVSLACAPGELVALVGPNGAGKTTLLRCLVGLQTFEGEACLGERRMDDLRRTEIARQVAYLPQGHVFHWPMSVRDVVAIGRIPHLGGADLGESDSAAVDRAMVAAGVDAFAGRPVTTLSGGERARVALARALAGEAPILLADEPTASLDLRYQLVVSELLRDKANAGGAVLAVMHDLGLAARYADRIAVLHQGRIVADGPPGDILTESLIGEVFGIAARIIEVAGTPIAVPVAADPDGA